MNNAGEVAVDRRESLASPTEEEQSIPKRFAVIAVNHANRIAVSANSAEWTYAELDQRSSALAGQILERRGASSEPVALLMEHGAALIAAILAILKSGKIYLSLDPSHPIERLSAMLADSRSGLLIADQANVGLARSLARGQLSILPVPDDFTAPSVHANFPEVSPKAGAWLMYTSGSTGTPKGIWQNHCGVMHHANVYGELIQLMPEDRLSLLTSCSLAASATPLFAALLNGAMLCPFHVRSQGVERLAVWLYERGITIYHSVPTVFRQLTRAVDDNGLLANLRVIRLGGEPLFSGDVEVFGRRCPDDCRLMNVLSSTETGLICAAMIDKHTVLPSGRVPVGRAVRDVDVFLANEQGQPIGNGCDGRIVVRSAYLRQGYWLRPDATAEKFQIDPRVPNTRTFITNDLGRFLPDGNLEHLGRADRVVKIRGLRADLSEIEAALQATDLFEETVVTASEDTSNGWRLVAFVVPRPQTDCSSHACRQTLQQLLPLPSRLVVLQELPRLANGKIDRLYLSKKAVESDTSSWFGYSQHAFPRAAIKIDPAAKSSAPSETLLSRLEKQLDLHSARPALKNLSDTWSYGELDAVSARCAASLQELEGQYGNPIAPVALLMQHDLPLIATIIGVLRSGAFYVALNPSHPSQRLRQIIEELRPCAVIVDAAHLAMTRGLGLPDENILSFEKISTSSGLFSTRPPCQDLLAVFYTSGSAGIPKPVFYSHGSALNEANNYARSLRISRQDRVTLLSPCSAGASVSSLFGALLNGACLLPFNPALEGLHKLRSWIETERISVYHSVPSLFRRLAQTLPADHIIPSIRAIKLGGESVFASDIELFHEHFRRDAILVNGLGITEANGNVAHFFVSHETRVSTLTVPVGRPLPGFEIKIIDESQREVGEDEPGEIAVRGQHISSYPDANNGFGNIPKSENGWFRTGDLGRWDKEGNLIHLGRKDNQLKSRGLWLSPAEIESALVRVPGVREAAAIPVDRGEGMKSLTAFLSWKTVPWSEQSLRLELQKQLPAHSVPNRFFTLKELPLLASGKIDRVTLARKAADLMRLGDSKADPDDALELQLVRIWEKVLGLDAVGTTDDFFALGGDSLGAATMFAAVEKFCGIDLPVAILLEAPTIRKFAEVIRRGGLSETDLRLVALRLRGSKPPLYCVPSAGADALEFRILTCHLADNQPVFAFQSPGLDGRSRCLRSVEEMAESYIHTMRLHQPHGPYYLCGNSFGGVVAFEMARRLVAQREEVRFLGLLDSYGGEYPKRRKSLAPGKRLKLALLPLLPRSEWYSFDLALFRSGFRQWMERWLVRRMIALDELMKFRVLRCRFKLRGLYIQEVCMAARRRYKLMPFSGKIDLFRAEHQPPIDLFEEDHFLGWSGMAADGIEVHQLPGHHGMHSREPAIAAVLARKLQASLEQASRKGS
jgi:amino acid adenylation domain-containing protein